MKTTRAERMPIGPESWMNGNSYGRTTGRFRQIDGADGPRGGDDADHELFGDADDPRGVDEKHHGQDADAQAGGLDDDAGIGRLEECRDAAEEQALTGGVERCRVGRRLGKEDRDKGENTAADDAEAGEALTSGRSPLTNCTQVKPAVTRRMPSRSRVLKAAPWIVMTSEVESA